MYATVEQVDSRDFKLVKVSDAVVQAAFDLAYDFDMDVPDDVSDEFMQQQSDCDLHQFFVAILCGDVNQVDIFGNSHKRFVVETEDFMYAFGDTEEYAKQCYMNARLAGG